MMAQDVVEHLKAQSGKEVVLRVADMEHAIRGMYEAGAAVIIEAGEVITTRGAIAPEDALREAEQITPVAEVVPDEVLEEGKEPR
jgi:hypothetical protein